GIVNTANYRMDTLFLGYFLNPSVVGHYNLGDNLASLPTREATAPIAHTLFPAFARLAATPEHLPQAYQRAQTTLCAVAFPVAIGFA
ncbi:oligosaccharide flippase family protein, partial [Acinetobacter baumannii]